MRWSDVVRRIKRLELLRKDQKKQTGDADGFFTALGVDGHLFNYDVNKALEATTKEDWADYAE